MCIDNIIKYMKNGRKIKYQGMYKKVRYDYIVIQVMSKLLLLLSEIVNSKKSTCL